MADLLDRRLIVVTGKGGVGKSTVAATLGLVAAARGLRVVVAEVAARDDVSRMFGAGHALAFHERVVADGVAHVSIAPEQALHQYLADQLPVRAMADLLTSSRTFSYVVAAAPGMRELLTVGKVWELAQPTRRTHGAHPYDLVILDAPATGHAVAMLDAPRTFSDVARVGPVARQGRQISAMLTDPASTAVVAVTTAEELPVSETVSLRRSVRETLGHDLALTIVNGLRPDRFSSADAALLAADPPDAPGARAVAVALRAHDTARAQRGQLGRLRRALHHDVPVATLPFVGDGEMTRDSLAGLARRLAPRVDTLTGTGAERVA